MVAGRTIKVEAIAEADGEVRLRNLPCKQGDRIEAIVTVPEENSAAEREAAFKRIEARALNSPFRSTGNYPTRDELHERD
jgi:hypothetical protein